MSINSRNKGATFEREVCRWIEDEFGVKVRRNLEQYQVVDLGDILLSPFTIECKRYGSGNWHKPDWWEQVCRAARDDSIPLLIYRFDRQPTRLVFPLYALGDYPTNNDMTCTVGLEEGAMIIREVLNATRRLQAPSEPVSQEAVLGSSTS
jgi:hypothetical protein